MPKKDLDHAQRIRSPGSASSGPQHRLIVHSFNESRLSDKGEQVGRKEETGK